MGKYNNDIGDVEWLITDLDLPEDFLKCTHSQQNAVCPPEIICSSFRRENNFLYPPFANVRPSGHACVYRIPTPLPDLPASISLVYFVPLCPLEPPSVSNHLSPSVIPHSISSSVLKDFRRYWSSGKANPFLEKFLLHFLPRPTPIYKAKDNAVQIHTQQPIL